MKNRVMPPSIPFAIIAALAVSAYAASAQGPAGTVPGARHAATECQPEMYDAARRVREAGNQRAGAFQGKIADLGGEVSASGSGP